MAMMSMPPHELGAVGIHAFIRSDLVFAPRSTQSQDRQENDIHGDFPLEFAGGTALCF